MPESGRHEEKRIDLVFEGGGVKGIGLAGAVSVLLERGYRPQNLAGTSAGAIAAALIAAGYTADELKEIILGLDYRRFRDEAWEDRLPLAGKPASILLDQGIYEGKAFLSWMRDLLAAKNVVTFADLVHPEFEDDPRYRYRLQVIASDVTGRRMLVLPQDAHLLGIEPDELDVALAIRMTMSIPIFFEPVRLRNTGTGREHLIVDGGMLSNFPVWLFDVEGEPEWPTFGLLLVEPDTKTPIGARLSGPDMLGRGVGPLIDYLKSLAETVMEGQERLYLDTETYARTICIPTLGVKTTEFDLERERALELYQSGVTAAEKFLETWSFEGYVAAYRSGKKHSRRGWIAEEMRKAALV